MARQSFNNFRFKNFEYIDHSHKYWDFKHQVNSDKSKAIVRVDDSNIFSYYGDNGWKVYVLKLDRNHCVFLKHWQYFQGYYGTYILLDKDYYHIVDAKEPFDDMAEKGSMMNWQEVLDLATSQEKNMKNNEDLILLAKN